MLAVALMAMLAAVIPVSQVHAAPYVTNCTATHWVIYAEDIGSDSGYIFDLQAYELRDSANNYCGKVYTQVGVTVPAHAGPNFRVYDLTWRNGSFLFQKVTYYLNNYPCCENGTYWSGNSSDQFSYTLGHGDFVTVEGMLASSTGTNYIVAGSNWFL
jgi:hypothetical protein